MSTPTLEDPRSLYARPEFPQPKQDPPGTEAEMNPAADHGDKSYQGHGLLMGRRALITGADSGIGRAVAIAFAREGADVAISYLSEDDDARETERLVRDAGRKAVVLPGDIGDAAVCEQIIAGAREALGGIDILVNNAAHQRTYSAFDDIPQEDFEETYRVNIFAMFRLCQLVLPHLPVGGSIINVASIQSYDPSPELLPYASTKAAIASFTNSLAGLLIEKGIRVNAVAPGPVWTPLIPATLPEKKTRQFGSNTVFGRPAQPAELAPLFVFLASNQASYVTGEVYGATGGRMPV